MPFLLHILKPTDERETVQEGKKAKTMETKESRGDDEQIRDDRKEKRE